MNRTLISAASELCAAVQGLHFAPPVAHVYNPLDYARDLHEAYLRAFGHGPKRTVFLGMNPGPFGMVQTGVPFGEVAAVRDWMKLRGTVRRPEPEHPKRPVLGLACPRSEVSGRRLWGLFAQRFPTAADFFADHFVVNYCPLAFLEESGRNVTPDRLPRREADPLLAACDAHLRRVTEALAPQRLVAVGDFALAQARRALAGLPVQIGRILHPSPASPAANRDWAGAATRQLVELGVWTES